MKEFLISLITFPGIIIAFYVIGLFSTRLKTKLKFFSYALFLFSLISLPILSKILSFPLFMFPQKYDEEKLMSVKAGILLTGGIYQNALGEWQPSWNTDQRATLTKYLQNRYNFPVIISGGSTNKNGPSEAEVTRKAHNIYNSILEKESVNTYESAKNLKKFCSSLDGPLLIITDKYHTLRSYLSFKSQGCNVIPYKNKIEISFEDAIPDLMGFSEMNKVIYEYVGLLYYIGTLKINPIKINF